MREHDPVHHAGVALVEFAERATVAIEGRRDQPSVL